MESNVILFALAVAILWIISKNKKIYQDLNERIICLENQIKETEQNEAKLQHSKNRINVVGPMNVPNAFGSSDIQKNSSEEILKERYEKEFIGSVSHTYDENNQWIGYEFITELASNHIAIKYMSSEGKLTKIKHTFGNAPYDCPTDEDFSNYMNTVRSRAEIYNSDYLAYSKFKKIDLHSSIDDAKSYRKYGIDK
jgi:hypothetical protein